MATSHSTSKMLASMIGKRELNTAKSSYFSDVMNHEQSDAFTASQPQLDAQQKLNVDYGQALTHIFGANATKQYSPMDNTFG